MISLAIAQGADEARKVFNDANVWYGRNDTMETVRTEARKVCAWLLENKHSTDKRGDEKSEPWWPELDPTTDDDRLDLRMSVFRMRLFGHGMRRLLNRMVVARLLGQDALDVIDELTDFACMAFYEELVGYALSKNPNTTVSLVDLKTRFNLSVRTNPTKMRDGIVQRMAKCGLWHVKVDDEGRFAIKLGPVAKVFHEEVFSPVRKQYKPLISGESK